jgi:hypothetical protein
LLCRVDPFDPESPIKKMGISRFPPDMFFVLRVTQLLRGLAQGMGVEEFSASEQVGRRAGLALHYCCYY